MITLGAASVSTLDHYKNGIKDLATYYPDAWGVVFQADNVMRSEHWDILF